MMNATSNPITPQNQSGCARRALFVFFLTFGPAIIIVGYLTNNPILSIVLVTLFGYLVAFLGVGVFEELIEKGFGHIDEFFTKEVPNLLRWLWKQAWNPIVAYIILAIVVTMLLTIPLITPELRASACLQTPLRLVCGNGIGITQIAVDDKGNISPHSSENVNIMNIGIIDENMNTSFAKTDNPDTDPENLIFKEDQEADKGPHFTQVFVTTLSRVVPDSGLSVLVGLEDLRGAYLAQLNYNKHHTVKLRLLIANIGVKFAARTTAPLVAEQLALFKEHAPSDAHFIGVVGFPFSVSALSALPILQQNGIPLVSPTASSNLLSNKPDFYRIVVPDSQQDMSIEDFIKNTLQPKHMVVFYDNRDPYSKSLSDDITSVLSRYTNLKTFRYSVGDPASLDKPLTEALKNNPDMLFFAGYSDDLNALIEKLTDQQRQNMRIMGGAALYELGGYSKANYSHIYFTSIATPEEQSTATDVGQGFKMYSKVFDPDGSHPGIYGFSRPDPDSMLSYDAVYAYLSAVQQLGDNPVPSLDQVKVGLAGSTVDGASGQTKFVGSDPITKPVYVLCVDGEHHTHIFVTYTPGLPASGQGASQSPPSFAVCN